MLSIKKICKSFGDIKAINDVNITLKKGEVITLFGPNGAGKSTLIKIISGVIDQDNGSIEFNNKDIKNQREEYLKNIGYMPENTPLYQDLSVVEFLFFMAKIKKIPTKNVEDVIKKLSLQSVKNQKIETLSKGFKSRTAVAQALLSSPKILILDEPTEGLDPNQKQYLRDLLKEYAKENIVLISTHIIEEAQELGSRVLVLNKGDLILDSSVLDIIKKHAGQTFAHTLRTIMENK